MKDDEETSVAESMLAKPDGDDAGPKDEQPPARERFGKFKVPPDRHITGFVEMKATDSE